MTNFIVNSQGILSIIVSLILIASVLMQDSKGTPINSTNDSQAYFKPKGKDAFLNNLTAVSGALLFIVSLLNLFVK